MIPYKYFSCISVPKVAHAHPASSIALSCILVKGAVNGRGSSTDCQEVQIIFWDNPAYNMIPCKYFSFFFVPKVAHIHSASSIELSCIHVKGIMTW